MNKPVLANIDSLIPYENNSRTHSDSQIEQLAKSIDEFGFVGAIVVRDGVIAKGHGCLAAIKLLLDRGEQIYPAPGKHAGIKPFNKNNHIPVIDASGWSDAQFKAYVIADNKLAENAGWDMDLVRVELDDLKLDGFDLDTIGFSGAELAEIFATGDQGKTDENDIPEPQERTRTKLGDVWLLGDHRLVCGDCTIEEIVKACLGGAKPHLMVTDPPYGVDYDSGWREGAMPEKNTPNGARGKVSNDHESNWTMAWLLFHGDVAYVWHAGNKANIVGDSLNTAGFEIRAQIIWNKNQHVISRGHYHPKHEPCWYAVRKGATGHWQGNRKQSTVWDIDKPVKSETGHSTQKPVECMLRPIENNSEAGDHIYEPFSGSGTTIIAADKSGRICHAIELNPIYIDVAVNRWQDFTGKVATNEQTGKTFNKTRYRKA